MLLGIRLKNEGGKKENSIIKNLCECLIKKLNKFLYKAFLRAFHMLCTPWISKREK